MHLCASWRSQKVMCERDEGMCGIHGVRARTWDLWMALIPPAEIVWSTSTRWSWMSRVQGFCVLCDVFRCIPADEAQNRESCRRATDKIDHQGNRDINFLEINLLRREGKVVGPR